MNQFDAATLATIERISSELEQTRLGLYAPHGYGCRCSETALCAHHATVNHFLLDAIEALHAAAGTVMQREE